MRRAIPLAFLVLLPLPAAAQMPVDVSQVRIAGLNEPDWGRRAEDNRVRYLCRNTVRCPLPTGVEIASADGAASVAHIGTRVLAAEPMRVDGLHCMHMEVSAEPNGGVHVATRCIADHGRMLDVTVKARTLEAARALAGTAARSLAGQMAE